MSIGTDDLPSGAQQLDTGVDSGGVTLIFQLAGELFGLEVGHVQEIIDPLPLTTVPNADPFAPGLVNVRGSVVPAIDMHLRLGLPRSEQTADSRLLVIETEIAGEPTKLAMLADSVDEIVDFEPHQIDPLPPLGTKWPPDFVTGIAKRDRDLFVLLNAAAIFSPRAVGLNAPSNEGKPC